MYIQQYYDGSEVGLNSKNLVQGPWPGRPNFVKT